MKKALMYASVASMIQQFNMNNIKLLLELGYKVDVACNFELGSTISKERIEQLKQELTELGVNYYHIPITRNISNLKDIYASLQMTRKLINKERYDLIHCHSPIGGLICREANRHSKNYKNCKMIYTAHGFHFFKGNKPINNFVFRTIEKHAARFTDVLITINKEDYEAAKKFKLKKNGHVEYVPGVGIDIEKINSIQGNKEELCKELGIPVDSILLLSVGELSKRKNHEVIVRTLSQLSNNIHYLICGKGDLENYLLDLAKEYKVEGRLHLLGYRTNIPKIMKSCDIFVFPSLQEGLPVALMEAMACELPCIVSPIRGNIDLIEQGVNGYYFDGDIQDDLKSCVNNRKRIIRENANKIKQFSTINVQNRMSKIYLQKKKVLHLITTDEIGGAQILCISIINNMNQEYDCIYSSPDGDIRKKIEDNNIDFYPLKKFSLLAVRKVIRDIKPDLIHAHDIRATVYAALMKQNGLPLISHIHGKFEDMSIISFRSILYKMIMPKISTIICVSKSVFDEFYWKKDINIKGQILENKIDANEISKRLDNIECAPCYDFVFMGRLEPVKNPIRYIELINNIQLINPEITACIVGDGSLYDECVKYIETKNINIDILGFQKEPLRFIKNCKALVMTSIAEGIPLAALEALSCGKPIISTPSDGLCDIIQHGLNGFICKSDQEFITCMNALKNDEKYKQMCSYIIENNSNEFEKYIFQIKEIYNNLGGDLKL